MREEQDKKRTEPWVPIEKTDPPKLFTKEEKAKLDKLKKEIEDLEKECKECSDKNGPVYKQRQENIKKKKEELKQIYDNGKPIGGRKK